MSSLQLNSTAPALNTKACFNTQKSQSWGLALTSPSSSFYTCKFDAGKNKVFVSFKRTQTPITFIELISSLVASAMFSEHFFVHLHCSYCCFCCRCCFRCRCRRCRCRCCCFFNNYINSHCRSPKSLKTPFSIQSLLIDGLSIFWKIWLIILIALRSYMADLCLGSACSSSSLLWYYKI